jgi:hypothetical protein
VTETQQSYLAWGLIVVGVVSAVKGVKFAWQIREEKQRQRNARKMYGDIER